MSSSQGRLIESDCDANLKSNHSLNRQNCSTRPSSRRHSFTSSTIADSDNGNVIIVCLVPIKDDDDSFEKANTCTAPATAKGKQINRSTLTYTFVQNQEVPYLWLGSNKQTNIQDDKLSSMLAFISVENSVLPAMMNKKVENTYKRLKRNHPENDIPIAIRKEKKDNCNSSIDVGMNRFKPHLTVMVPSTEHFIHINGQHVQDNHRKKTNPSPLWYAKTELFNGNIISLYKHQYRYRVHCINPLHTACNESNDCNNATNTSNKEEQHQTQLQSSSSSSLPPPPTITISNKLNPLQLQAQQNILHQLKCPICFEILINTTATHPCGHLFCHKCISSVHTQHQQQQQQQQQQRQGNLLSFTTSAKKESSKTHCPSCRKSIKKLTKICMYDELIWDIICLNQAIFCNGGENNNRDNHVYNEVQGDIECYLQRRGKTAHELNLNERKSIFGTDYEKISANIKQTKGTGGVAVGLPTSKKPVQVPTLPSESTRQQRRRLRRAMNNSTAPVSLLSSQLSQSGRSRLPMELPMEVEDGEVQDIGQYLDLTNTFNFAPPSFFVSPQLQNQQQQQQQLQQQQQQHQNGNSADDPIVL